MTERTLPERLRTTYYAFADAEIIRAVMNEAADALDAKSALLAEAEKALEAVEDWWLGEGMEFHKGAPYAATRTILAKLKAANEKPAPQPEGHGAG